MKKLLSVLLAICLGMTAMPFAFAQESYSQNVFGESTVSPSSLSAFENGYKGYLKSMDIFEGKMVHVLKRDGSDETENGFCYYRWSSLPDENGESISLATANYIVVDYYYKSADASPALEGNKVRWTQVKVATDTTTDGFGVTASSRNGMVANKWDKLVIPFDEAAAASKQKLASKPYFLHQIKLYPLERDMGKDDVLYIGSIKIQSWDPLSENSISERTVRFFAHEDDAASNDKAIASVKANDLSYFAIPEFTGTAPKNMEFMYWKNTFDGTSAEPGESVQMLAGQDIAYVPVFNYIFDFSGYENAYINGYTDGTFAPQNNVTRAEAAKMIASIVNPTGESMGETAFSDVAPTDWFYPYVTTLEALGALDIFEGTFEQSKKITRSELVEIVYAIADKNYESTKLSYITDVDYQNRFFDAVMYAVSAGIVTGYDDGTFRPFNNITRAETVTIINRMLGRVWNGAGDAKFSDINEHWAKGQIIASASAKADNTWTVNSETREYVLEGTNAEGYIKALHAQSKNLTGDAIRRGIDTVAEQMKKDILNTPNTQEIYGDKLSGKIYYISEKNGDDANDGLSPETAKKTLTGAGTLRFPKAILFERGGVYRGTVNTSQGAVYGSYGTGEKPIITGSLKNYADASLWEATDVANVYKLKDALTNVGVITFDHAQNAHGNYDGLYGKIRIYGKNISDYSGLTQDLEFLSTPGVLYVYSEGGNPGERFTSIEIGTNMHIFHGSGKNVIIDNLHIKNTGGHGLSYNSGSNLLVTNCEFSWLGGSLMGSYGDSISQYGNAVQIYGSCDGYYVRNNWMYQIYDTAITHQGPDYTMKNIDYSSNLMEYVHWGIECWISTSKGDPMTENYTAKYNVMRNGGYGWGTIVANRPGAARLYSFTTLPAKNSNMHSEFNIIDRCSSYLLDIDTDSTETFDSYILVQDEGKTLGRLRGTQYGTNRNATALVKENLGDNNVVMVMIPR